MQPIDSAWNLLKALSREDLEMAARTGGIGMTDARRQAYADQDLPLSTGGGFRTMPDSEAQRIMQIQRNNRQGSAHEGTHAGFKDMGMEDFRGNQFHDADSFQDPNFEPMVDSFSLRPEDASLEDPSFAERHEPEQPEPEFDPELSSFHNRDRRQSPSGEAFTYLKRKKEAEARRMQEVRERGRRMPQQQQRRDGRRPGEGKNAYRNRMNRQRRR